MGRGSDAESDCNGVEAVTPIPPVEDHEIEVCAEADVLDCDDDDTDDDDWTVLVERHPQASGYEKQPLLPTTGLAAGSTRHYRVSSRNSFGHGDPSEVKSGTTRSMPTSADCRGATWEATMTVDSFGLHDDQGYRARGKVGGGDDEGALTNYTFMIGDVTYEVNQLWYGPSVFTPTQRLGWVYHPPSYHFALSKFPGDAMQCRRPADESTSEGGCKLDDLTLYVGGLALPMSTAGYSHSGVWRSLPVEHGAGNRSGATPAADLDVRGDLQLPQTETRSRCALPTPPRPWR